MDGSGVVILEISDGGIDFLDPIYFSDRVFVFRQGFYFSDTKKKTFFQTFFNWILCNRSIVCLFSDKINDYLVTNPINNISKLI